VAKAMLSARLIVCGVGLYAVFVTWALCFVSTRLVADSAWSDPARCSTLRDSVAVFATDMFFDLHSIYVPHAVTVLWLIYCVATALDVARRSSQGQAQ
jgi:hypothetical protein